MAGATPEASDTVVAVEAVDAAVEVTVAEVTAAEVSGTVVKILLHCNCFLVLLFDEKNCFFFLSFILAFPFLLVGDFLFLFLCHGFS